MKEFRGDIMNYSTIGTARKLRLAVVTSAWKNGLLSDDEAKELLNGYISQVKQTSSTYFDDSALLGNAKGLDKIDADMRLIEKKARIKNLFKGS